MDTLDLLISKFKEAKEELAKSDTSTNSVEQTVEELEKYMSPFFMFGSSKKNTAPVAPAKPARLTGSDKIAAVSKETIRPTSVNRDGTPAPAPAAKPPKLTGLDRIKAESQKPITKSEKDLLKQDTGDSKFINVKFGKSINGSYDGAVNQGGMVKGCGEKVSLSKAGQWSILNKEEDHDESKKKEDVEKSDHVKAKQMKPDAIKATDWNRSDGKPDKHETSHGTYEIHPADKGHRLEYTSKVTGRSHDLGTHSNVSDAMQSHHESVLGNK